ncbi:Uroporphyrinogen-III synthase HemD-domain-containing protein [Scenedesmus sp. NREL 46B-D3]|nr:Uroporphyrinogen-III synthase HemD-domain-containing protein [Scenedesmus sp. NREL 46B-D3]
MQASLHRRCTSNSCSLSSPPKRACRTLCRAAVVAPGSQCDALATFDHLPLLNRRILITAPRQYASKLAALLVDAGARPTWVPGIAISRLSDHEQLQQLDNSLQQLESYSHLAFTSKNGILAVLERLAALHGGPEKAVQYVKQSGIKLCALGADGQVLREAGLQVHVSPVEASTKGLAAELAATGQAAGAHILCPVPHVAGGLVEPPVVPRFMDALTAAGAAAVRVPAYLTSVGLPSPECCAQEAALLQAGHFDAIAFSSTAEAQGLCLLMGGRQAVASAVQQHRTVLAAHGPYTAAGAGDVLGLAVPVVSRNFSSFDGLVAALADALH